MKVKRMLKRILYTFYTTCVVYLHICIISDRCDRLCKAKLLHVDRDWGGTKMEIFRNL